MPTSQNSVKEYYENLVKGYDEFSDKVVMENAALQKAIFEAINAPNEAEFKVLDLGIGTGSTAKKILESYPNSVVVGVDFSDEMTKVATHTLSRFSERVQLVQEDITSFDFSSYGKFDFVISAVTIHNIPHDSKKYLFEKIYNYLVEGGMFINGDFVSGETDEEESETKSLYRKFLESNLRGDELEKWLKHAFEFDMPMKLSEQVAILEQIGFRDFKVLWQYPRETVYSVIK